MPSIIDMESVNENDNEIPPDMAGMGGPVGASEDATSLLVES